MIRLLKLLIYKIKKILFLKDQIISQKSLLIQAKLLEKSFHDVSISSINDVEFSVYSQFGEDGIISYLINQIPDVNRSFIEFGVQDYFESNSRYLLQSRNWSGLVIDGSESYITSIMKDDLFWKYDLEANCMFITKDNINNVLSKFSKHVGVLSIDIDGNDYWVWKNIKDTDADIVIIEYNSLLGDNLDITVPYWDNFDRKKAHYSHLYFGCSIKSLINLSDLKGYTFIGTASTGVNAFFVKNKHAEHIINENFKKYIHRSKFRESRSRNGKLDYLDFLSSYNLISNERFYCNSANNIIPCPSMEILYSQDWIHKGYIEF